MFRYLYHASRVVFGGWWLFSGLMHFLWPELQPLGDEPEAIAFTRALMASGLFDWIKVIEVVLGLTMLANRAMPLTIVALVPLNVVIFGSAPAASSRFITGTSPAWAARMNAVWPVKSTHSSDASGSM